jgi:hypothetical protein
MLPLSYLLLSALFSNSITTRRRTNKISRNLANRPSISSQPFRGAQDLGQAYTTAAKQAYGIAPSRRRSGYGDRECTRQRNTLGLIPIDGQPLFHAGQVEVRRTPPRAVEAEDGARRGVEIQTKGIAADACRVRLCDIERRGDRDGGILGDRLD